MLRRFWLDTFGPKKKYRRRREMVQIGPRKLGPHRIDADMFEEMMVRQIEHLLDRSANIVMVDGNNDVVSFCSYEVKPEPGGQRVFMHYVWVRPDLRGQGLAKRLVETVSMDRPVTYSFTTKAVKAGS